MDETGFFSVPGAFKLNNLQTFRQDIFWPCSQLSSFLLRSPFLILLLGPSCEKFLQRRNHATLGERLFCWALSKVANNQLNNETGVCAILLYFLIIVLSKYLPHLGPKIGSVFQEIVLSRPFPLPIRKISRSRHVPWWCYSSAAWISPWP